MEVGAEFGVEQMLNRWSSNSSTTSCRDILKITQKKQRAQQQTCRIKSDKVELGWVGLSQVLLNNVDFGWIMLGKVGEVSWVWMG